MKTLRENYRRGTLLCKLETGQCTGSILQTVFGCNLQYVDVSALLFSGWFFTCKPRPAVQEYGEGEHDLYGGDAQVSGWPTL